MLLRTLVRRFLLPLAAAALPFAATATPTAYVSFFPGASANLGDPVILSISLIDSGTSAITNAQLAPGVFQFPAGMTSSTTMPAPSTNCAGGTVTSTPGSNTMSFSVPNVPASTSCGIEVYVDFAGPGTYTAALPSNAITTDQGPATNAQDGVITIVGPAVTTVTNTNDSGPGSLRDAINTVNATCTGGPNTIAFNIPGTGPQVIAPTALSLPLPPITCDQTTIDGYTQPGSAPNAGPQGCTSPAILIELSGAACGSGCSGLMVQGSNVVVKGLAIHSFPYAGIVLSSSGAGIFGNIIGSDASGNSVLPNGSGIVVQLGSADIGSGSDADRNLIVNNIATGIDVESASVSVDNNQLGGTPSCGTGNGNTTGIFFSDSAFTSTVTGTFIRYGTGEGISVMSGAVGNVRLGANSIADNGGIGVDMRNDGVTVNDEASTPYDQDGVQNYPVITGISFNGSFTTISGYLKSLSNRSGSILVYQNSRVIPNFTEGETVVAATSVGLDATGFGTWSAVAEGYVDNLSAMVDFDTCGDGCLVSSEFSPTVTQASLTPFAGPMLNVDGPFESDAIVGYDPADTDYTLTNVGDQDLMFPAAPFSLSSGDFSLSPATGCLGVTLKPSESCNLQLRFSPVSAGPQTVQLTITSNAVGSPTNEDIFGYGLLPLEVSIVTPATPAAGSGTTAQLVVTNPNPSGAPTYGGVFGTLTIPAGFTLDATSAPTCPTFDPNVASATLRRAAGHLKATVVQGGVYVPSGMTCTVYDAQLTAPAQPGPYTFAVNAGDFVAASPQAWSLPSAVQATVTVVAASLTVAPGALAFGSVTTGSTSAAQSVTLQSSSRLAVPITSITFPAGYQVDSSSCAGGVPPTGCVLNVSFAPTAPGPANGNLQIDAGGATYTVALTGTGAAAPAPGVSFSPPSLTFAPRAIGTTSPPSAVTLTNSGNANLSIGSITVTGDFGFTSSCSSTIPLLPGGSCQISVSFSPLVGGTRTGSLSVASNAPGSPHTLALSGVGQSSAVATLSVNPSTLDFDAHGIGTTSAVQTVLVVNSGNVPMHFAFSVTAPFAIAPAPANSSDCPPALDPGGACEIGVTFTPTQVGAVSGALVFTSDASNPRVTVQLSGRGVSTAPLRALSVPGTVDFGSQPFGLRSAAHAFTITNLSDHAVTISDIVLTGDFTADEGCPTVPAHGTCSVNLYFTPSARGARSGQLTLTAAGETQAYLTSLVGDGGVNPLPVLTVSPLQVGFGNAITGPAGPRATLHLANTGELPVLLGNIVSPGDFLATSHCPASLAVHETCDVDITFFPRVIGLRAATLTIPSNAGNGPHHVELSGVGCSLPNAARARIPQLVCSP